MHTSILSTFALVGAVIGAPPALYKRQGNSTGAMQYRESKHPLNRDIMAYKMHQWERILLDLTSVALRQALATYLRPIRLFQHLEALMGWAKCNTSPKMMGSTSSAFQLAGSGSSTISLVAHLMLPTLGSMISLFRGA